MRNNHYFLVTIVIFSNYFLAQITHFILDKFIYTACNTTLYICISDHESKTLSKRLMNKITFFLFSFIIKLILPKNNFFTVYWAIPFFNHTGGWTNFFRVNILDEKIIHTNWKYLVKIHIFKFLYKPPGNFKFSCKIPPPPPPGELCTVKK